MEALTKQATSKNFKLTADRQQILGLVELRLYSYKIWIKCKDVKSLCV